MNKSIIIYDGSVAGSVLSAAIQLQKIPNAEVCDVTAGDPGTDFNNVYAMIPNGWDGAIVVSAPEEKGGKDGYRKNRSLLVWEREFPGVTRPLVVHYMGGFQLREDDLWKSEAIKLAIVTFLSNLSNATVRYEWGRLFSNDKATLAKYLEKGDAICAHQALTALREEPKESGEDVEALKASLKKVSDECSSLTSRYNEVNKANKAQADMLDCMDELFFVHSLTPKQVKDRYTVTELRRMCPRIGGPTGYNNMSQDDLVKGMRKILKGIFPAPK